MEKKEIEFCGVTVKSKDWVETYKGVDITKSCGYYYPAVNGNVESNTIQEVRDYIDNVWLFVTNHHNPLT